MTINASLTLCREICGQQASLVNKRSLLSLKSRKYSKMQLLLALLFASMPNLNNQI